MAALVKVLVTVVGDGRDLVVRLFSIRVMTDLFKDGSGPAATALEWTGVISGLSLMIWQPCRLLVAIGLVGTKVVKVLMRLVTLAILELVTCRRNCVHLVLMKNLLVFSSALLGVTCEWDLVASTRIFLTNVTVRVRVGLRWTLLWVRATVGLMIRVSG